MVKRKRRRRVACRSAVAQGATSHFKNIFNTDTNSNTEEEEVFCRRSATSFPHRGASGITVGRGSPFIKRGGAPLRKARGGVPAGIPCESLMCLHGLPPRGGISNPRGPSLSTATYGAGGTDNGRDDRRRCRWQLEHWPSRNTSRWPSVELRRRQRTGRHERATRGTFPGSSGHPGMLLLPRDCRCTGPRLPPFREQPSADGRSPPGGIRIR